MTMSIPKVAPAEIKRLASRIQPLVRRDGKLHSIKMPDLFHSSYMWDPVLVDEVTDPGNVLCEIRTLHTYGYYGLFKPSVAEVLAQIPKQHVAAATGFEIVESPQHADDLNREREAFLAGFHVAVTRIYGHVQ